MRKLLLASSILLLISASAFGATPLYVDPTVASSGDGTTISTDTDDAHRAMKTIAEAILAVDAGGEVLLRSVSFDTDSQGAMWGLTLAGTKSMTIKPDEGIGTVTLNTGNATQAVLFSTTDSAVHFTLENLIIVNSGGATRVCTIDTTAAGTLEFKDCTIDMGSKNFYAPNGAGAATRDLIFDGCTISSSNSLVLHLRGMDRLYVQDCAITCTGACFLRPSNYPMKDVRFEGNTITYSGNGGFIVSDLTGAAWESLKITDNTATLAPSGINTLLLKVTDVSGAIRALRIEGNTINVTSTASDPQGVIYLGAGSSVYTTATLISGGIIHNNVITTAKANYYAVAIRCGQDVRALSITDNIIKGFQMGLDLCGYDHFISGNVIDAMNPVRCCGGARHKVINNVLISNDGHYAGQCLVLGRMVAATSTAETAFTATTVIDQDTDGSAWSSKQANVSGDQIALVTTAVDSLLPKYYGRVVSIGTDNTLTVDAWRTFDSDGTVVTATASDLDTMYVNVVEFAQGCEIVGNILDARNATSCLNGINNPYNNRSRIDWNCLLAGSSKTVGLSNIGNRINGGTTTLSGLQAMWLLFETTYADNSANSVTTAVSYVDATNNNYRTSPVLYGETTTAGGQSRVGAEQVARSSGGGILHPGR